MRGKHTGRRNRESQTLTPAAPTYVVHWKIGSQSSDRPRVVAEAAATVATPPEPALAPQVAEPTETTSPRTTPIECLSLNQTTYSRLKTQGINSAGELSDYNKKIPGIAQKRREEIATALQTLGLPCNLPQ